MRDRPSTPFTRDTCPAFVTVAEAAAICRCSPSAIHDALKQGLMAKAPSLTPRVVRIPREALWPDGEVEPLGFEDRHIVQAVRTAGLHARIALEQVCLAVERIAEIEAALALKAERD